MSNPAGIIRSLQDLTMHDYSTIFPNNPLIVNNTISKADWLYQWFVHPRIPIFAILAYLLFSKKLFKLIREVFHIEPKGAFIQNFTILHSALLAVYSIWTCYNTASIVIPLFMERGFYDVLCDVNGEIWFDKGFGFWVTHFYLSKYYEFIDTWIIILKGRDPMFLQTYHHAGVVLFMWGFVITGCTLGGIMVTVLNSFIHSFMYTYYTLAAFGYSSPLKHYLTQAQMIQFLVGISLTLPGHWKSNCCSPAQKLFLAGIQVYAIYLTYLFYQFYMESYSKKGNKKPSSSTKKEENVEKDETLAKLTEFSKKRSGKAD